MFVLIRIHIAAIITQISRLTTVTLDRPPQSHL